GSFAIRGKVLRTLVWRFPEPWAFTKILLRGVTTTTMVVSIFFSRQYSTPLRISSARFGEILAADSLTRLTSRSQILKALLSGEIMITTVYWIFFIPAGSPERPMEQ